MKKIIAIAFAAILAGLAISCQKEEVFSDKTDAVQYTFNITVNDRSGFDNGASTKGTATYKRGWENDDKIFLFFKPTSGSLLTDTYATLSYDGSAWGGSVTGSTNLGEKGTLSAVYVYKLGSGVTPEYSNSKWTIATGNVFYNCQAGVEYSVSGSEISATLNLVAPSDFVQFYVEGATGALTCDKVKGWKDVAIGSEMTVSNVTCTEYMEGFANSGDSNVMEYYGRIVSGTSLKNEECTFSVVKNGMFYEHTATPLSDGKSFSMNTSATDDKAWTETDKLPGLFSVGKGADDTAGTADDVLVRFSKGNLWYGPKTTEASSTFNFETNQYDISSLWDDSHVSNFYWSQTASSAYAEYYDNVGSTEDVLFTNEDGFTVNGMTNFWRTLSQAEWKYLLEERTMTNGKDRYSNAMKDGVTIDAETYKGIFLYPDNYNGDIVSGSMTWEQINAAGIVFLPSTGYRSGTVIDEVSDTKISCIYWTSTADSYDEAYRMFFKWDDSELEGSKLSKDFNSAGERAWAVGIRLVSDVK